MGSFIRKATKIFKMRDAGCQIPDARCRIPDARYWVLVTGYFFLVGSSIIK